MNNLYRIHPQAGMNFNGLVIDNFAGGGGASTGIEMALGRPVDIAINHDPEAIAMHEINHPHTRHFCESVWEVDPRVIADGRPVDLAWFSPDCKHFSKAKGGAPVKKEIRGLAWVAIRYAATVKPKVIMLENVPVRRTCKRVNPKKPPVHLSSLEVSEMLLHTRAHDAIRHSKKWPFDTMENFLLAGVAAQARYSLPNKQVSGMPVKNAIY